MKKNFRYMKNFGSCLYSYNINHLISQNIELHVYQFGNESGSKSTNRKRTKKATQTQKTKEKKSKTVNICRLVNGVILPFSNVNHKKKIVKNSRPKILDVMRIDDECSIISQNNISRRTKSASKLKTIETTPANETIKTSSAPLMYRKPIKRRLKDMVVGTDAMFLNKEDIVTLSNELDDGEYTSGSDDCPLVIDEQDLFITEPENKSAVSGDYFNKNGENREFRNKMKSRETRYVPEESVYQVLMDKVEKMPIPSFKTNKSLRSNEKKDEIVKSKHNATSNLARRISRTGANTTGLRDVISIEERSQRALIEKVSKRAKKIVLSSSETSEFLTASKDEISIEQSTQDALIEGISHQVEEISTNYSKTGECSTDLKDQKTMKQKKQGTSIKGITHKAQETASKLLQSITSVESEVTQVNVSIPEENCILSNKDEGNKESNKNKGIHDCSEEEKKRWNKFHKSIEESDDYIEDDRHKSPTCSDSSTNESKKLEKSEAEGIRRIMGLLTCTRKKIEREKEKEREIARQIEITEALREVSVHFTDLNRRTYSKVNTLEEPPKVKSKVIHILKNTQKVVKVGKIVERFKDSVHKESAKIDIPCTSNLFKDSPPDQNKTITESLPQVEEFKDNGIDLLINDDTDDINCLHINYTLRANVLFHPIKYDDSSADNALWRNLQSHKIGTISKTSNAQQISSKRVADVCPMPIKKKIRVEDNKADNRLETNSDNQPIETPDVNTEVIPEESAFKEKTIYRSKKFTIQNNCLHLIFDFLSSKCRDDMSTSDILNCFKQQACITEADIRILDMVLNEVRLNNSDTGILDRAKKFFKDYFDFQEKRPSKVICLNSRRCVKLGTRLRMKKVELKRMLACEVSLDKLTLEQAKQRGIMLSDAAYSILRDTREGRGNYSNARKTMSDIIDFVLRNVCT